MLTSLLTIVALAYGGLAALLFLFQDKLAYYPRRSAARYTPRRASRGWITKR